jgi:hypothetical protein
VDHLVATATAPPVTTESERRDMKIEDLTWTVINEPAGSTISAEVVKAVAFGARLGFGDATVARFLIALVQTDTLKSEQDWPDVLRKVRDLTIAREVEALKADRVVTGEVEG